MSGPTPVATMTCPNCGAAVGEGERFCESCGADLPVDEAAGQPPDGAAPASAAPDGASTSGTAAVPTQALVTPREGVVVAPVDLTARAATCAACGGTIAADGYCEQCGTPAPNPRDHWVDEPAPWVVAVCDRGVRHARNEDAVAVAARPEPASFAALVVCDGVSSAPDSDQASLAAARAARDVLVAAPADDRGDAAEQAERVMAAAGEAAHEAASAVARRVAGSGRGNPPSTTFVAALLDGRDVLVGWVGDSRAYWFPDAGTADDPAADRPPAQQLSVDDSWAAEAIALGVPREEAETGPNAHAITRWLGADAPDPRPRTSRHRLDGGGWLLLCSDGLWNYCSEANDLAGLVAATAEREATPRDLAGALVQWAVEQGGSDNISVALARVEA